MPLNFTHNFDSKTHQIFVVDYALTLISKKFKRENRECVGQTAHLAQTVRGRRKENKGCMYEKGATVMHQNYSSLNNLKNEMDKVG